MDCENVRDLFVRKQLLRRGGCTVYDIARSATEVYEKCLREAKAKRDLEYIETKAKFPSN